MQNFWPDEIAVSFYEITHIHSLLAKKGKFNQAIRSSQSILDQIISLEPFQDGLAGKQDISALTKKLQEYINSLTYRSRKASFIIDSKFEAMDKFYHAKESQQ